MKIWLTIADASRYSGGTIERVGTPHDDDRSTHNSGRPIAGRRQRGNGDGC
jgi:hypothetical protein